MYRLSLIILLFLSGHAAAQTVGTHGKNFKLDCKLCHNVQGWKIDQKSMTFNHDSTGFELTGQHKTLDCKSCHKTLDFNAREATCLACHQDIHNMTVGNDCARCHHTNSWLVDNIPELHEQNGFPLTGAHTVLSCVDCHKSESGLSWNRIGNDCINCHREDYNRAANPNHVQAGFSTDCIECHDPLSLNWGTNFNHDKFPLKFEHNTDCKACHKNNEFKSISQECYSCHQVDFQESKLPNHVGSGYKTDCKECHNPDPIDWKIPGFHDLYPLKDGHQIADCKACHKTENFSNTPTNCVSCHQNDFNQAQNPNHIGSGYSVNCIDCHKPEPVNWKIDGFHDKFPLKLGHDVVDCKTCHKSPDFKSTSPDCVTCHQTDFTGALLPNHVASRFSTNCVDCHNPSPVNWKVPGFHDHFPLTQGHNLNDCKRCHKTDDFTVLNPDCFSCHVADYNQTTNPAHKTLGFSTNCTECHTTAPGWTSNFNQTHDDQFFPIYSGKHQGEWSKCTDCHTNPTNYKVFNCLLCHEHNNATELANDHKGVTGYVYESNACFSCHPKGRN